MQDDLIEIIHRELCHTALQGCSVINRAMVCYITQLVDNTFQIVELLDAVADIVLGDDGVVALSLGKTPAAVLLEEVSTAVADAADICRGEGCEIQDVALGSGGYVFRLQDFDCVFEMYKADPQNFDRVWGGDNDLSATVAINVVGDEFHVDATTRDERPGDGDCLVVIADGVETRFLPAELTKGGARYFGRIPRPGRDAVLEIRIEDDDGRGKEGWVTTGRFRAPGADPIGGVRVAE